MDYVGNGSSLEEASRIKELKNDPEFVELLYKRFHENVLDSFGFRNGGLGQSQQPGARQEVAPARKTEDSYQSNQLKSQIIPGKRTPTQSV